MSLWDHDSRKIRFRKIAKSRLFQNTSLSRRHMHFFTKLKRSLWTRCMLTLLMWTLHKNNSWLIEIRHSLIRHWTIFRFTILKSRVPRELHLFQHPNSSYLEHTIFTTRLWKKLYLFIVFHFIFRSFYVSDRILADFPISRLDKNGLNKLDRVVRIKFWRSTTSSYYQGPLRIW